MLAERHTRHTVTAVTDSPDVEWNGTYTSDVSEVESRDVQPQESLSVDETLSVRKVAAADGPTLFIWRNDPLVREASRSNHVLTQEEHTEWLQVTLNDPDTHQFLVMRGQNDVGYVRFDQHGQLAEVSIYLNPEFRGLGLGVPVLLTAQRALVNASDFNELRAYVKHGNSASLRLFEAAGYSADTSEDHGTWYSWRADA